jgi:DNA sulfur modification protein DndB
MREFGLELVDNISTRAINLKKSENETKTISKEKLDEYLGTGWELVPSRLKKSVRVRRAKKHGVHFEDRVWALLAGMGFEYIKASNNFKIEYEKGLSKQIDVFACDSESIVFVECKSSEIRKRVSYQKDINELIAIKEKLRIAAQKIIPGKQKIAFIFATYNAIISETDKLRLETSSIHHFNQDDIEYFEQLTNHLGRASKYQFFAKLFSGQKIPELKNRVPAIKGKVSKGYTFYSFSIDPELLLKIGFILHRSDTNKDATTAYQRLVKKSRLKQIGNFINNDGYFPNSIIINIHTKKKSLKFEAAGLIEHDSSTKLGVLHLPQVYKSAFIIDGQHRLYGYSVANSSSNHTVPVVAFENLPPDEQTRIFVDINSTQKSVPANLLHSIKADFDWGSSNDKLALSALKTKLFIDMNSDESSPFYKRIVISEENKTDTRCLTLQTLKSWGLSKVNYFGKLKRDHLIKSGYLTDIDHEHTFRKAYHFFNDIFVNIESSLGDQWLTGSGEGGFIAMNIGVSAIFRTVDRVLEFLTNDNKLEPENLNGHELATEVIQYLEPVIEFVKDLDLEGKNKLRRLFGSGATEKVVWEFLYAINTKFNEFNPSGLSQWIKDNSGEYNIPSYELGHKRIEPLIDNFIKSKLKQEFGEKHWWIEGVPKEVQKKCANNKIEEGSTEPEHNFLNTIHYLTIIEKQWGLLGNYFTPPGMESEKKANRIAWLKKFNQIRKKYSHPQRENVSEDEYIFLAELNEWLSVKLNHENKNGEPVN